MSCPYGECRMRNLCRGHCVRKALERDGWDLQPDGDIKKREGEQQRFEYETGQDTQKQK